MTAREADGGTTPRRLRCLMLGIGAGFTFIDDWARMVAGFADVVGITPTSRLPSEATPVSPRLAMGSAAGFPVLFVEVPALRPKRLFWRLNRRWEDAVLVRGAERLEASHGPFDLVHSHFYAASGSVPAVAARLGVPYVHTEHTSQLIDPGQRVSPAGIAGLRRVFGGAARVLLVGSDQLEEARRLGLPGDMEVVPNPVDPSLFGFDPEAVRRGRRLVSVGKLRPLRRHDVVLRALQIAVIQRPDLELEIIGDGPQQHALVSLAAQLGLADRVSFPGRLPREEVARRLRRSDVYVHAADRETFGVALVEAMLSGLPVVARKDAGGVASDLPPEAGVSVSGDDPAEFAAAIVQVLDDQTFEPARIAALARERYAVDAVAARVRRVYREAVANG